MNSFPLINYHRLMITKPLVYTIEPEFTQMTSLKGRFICLVHLAATPLKAFSSLGSIVMVALEIFGCLLMILTLNFHPLKGPAIIGERIVDLFGGTALLPFALVANLVRGLVGVTIYPGAMICDISEHQKHKDFDPWTVNHYLLQGTLVNY